MSVSVKTSHLAPARFSKISFGLTETHPRGPGGVDIHDVLLKVGHVKCDIMHKNTTNTDNLASTCCAQEICEKP